MKLTSEKLKQIIKEEIIKEGWPWSPSPEQKKKKAAMAAALQQRDREEDLGWQTGGGDDFCVAKGDVPGFSEREGGLSSIAGGCPNAVGPGSTGEAVRKIQRGLLNKGFGLYLGKTGPKKNGVDGIFSGGTAKAVRAWKQWFIKNNPKIAKRERLEVNHYITRGDANYLLGGKATRPFKPINKYVWPVGVP